VVCAVAMLHGVVLSIFHIGSLVFGAVILYNSTSRESSIVIHILVLIVHDAGLVTFRIIH
jgi:hypothetical protein